MDGGTIEGWSLLGETNIVQIHVQSKCVFVFKSRFWTEYQNCHFLNQQINLGLLVFSLVGFLLPGYLFYHQRQIIKEKAALDSLSMSQSAQESNSLNQTNDSAKYQTNGNVWDGKHLELRCMWIIDLIYELLYHGTSETELLDFMFSHCSLDRYKTVLKDKQICNLKHQSRLWLCDCAGCIFKAFITNQKNIMPWPTIYSLQFSSIIIIALTLWDVH